MDTTQVVLALFGLIGVIGGPAVGYWFRSRLDDIREAERGLNDDRRKVYADVLRPMTRLLATIGTPNADAAVQEVNDAEKMRTAGFDLMLFASDGVARAYGDWMQYAFTGDKGQPMETMRLLAKIYLEVRRSLGNKNTKLTELDMLRFVLNDVKPFEDHLKATSNN